MRFGYLWLMGALAVGCSTGACSPSPAQAHYRGNYSITLEAPSGVPLRTFHHRGDRFVLGRFGNRYNIRVRNHTSRRVEAVVTVDGRDVISGRSGDFAQQRGYIVGPHDSVLIEGFRRNLSDVASFRFTDPGDSYSSRMGTPQNVGVIGVAFFPERRRPIAYRPPPPPVARSRRNYSYEEDRALPSGAPEAEASADEAAPSASLGGDGRAAGRSGYAPRRRSRKSATQRRSQLGTRYGEDRYSPVHEVTFRRARPRSPQRVLRLYYDNRDGLLARGIRIRPRRSPEPYVYAPQAPNPFPENRFAPPPPY